MQQARAVGVTRSVTRPVSAIARCRQCERQCVGHRRAAEAAFGQRAAPAEGNQRAAALVDEIRQHSQLRPGERRRLDVAENHRAVLEQFVAAGGKPAQQVERIIDVEPQILVLGAAQQAYQLQRAVTIECAPDKGKLRTWRPLEVEHLLAPRPDPQQRFRLVVLRHDFAGEWRGADRDDVGARSQGRHPHRYVDHITPHRQRHPLPRNHLPVGLQRQRRRIAAHPPHAERHGRHHAGAGERGARQLEAVDRQIPRKALLADAHRVHRDVPGLQDRQRRGEVAGAVVGSVADHHHPAQRQVGEVLPRGGERRGQVGPCAVGAQPRGASHRIGIGRKPEEAQREAIGKLSHQPGGIGKDPLHRRLAPHMIHIGNLHAAGIVEQHRQHVPLGNRVRQRQRRPQQAGGQHHEQQPPQRPQHHPVADSLHPEPPREGHDDRHDHHRTSQQQRGRHHRGQNQLTSLEYPERIFEQEREDGLQSVTSRSRMAAKAGATRLRMLIVRHPVPERCRARVADGNARCAPRRAGPGCRPGDHRHDRRSSGR